MPENDNVLPALHQTFWRMEKEIEFAAHDAILRGVWIRIMIADLRDDIAVEASAIGPVYELNAA